MGIRLPTSIRCTSPDEFFAPIPRTFQSSSRGRGRYIASSTFRLSTNSLSTGSKMSANFVGKYQRTSAEKYEEFLAALGVNYLLRKAATVSTRVMEVSEEGGNWVIKTSTTLKSMELKFKLDEEFEETTPDGRDVKAIVKMDGNKLISTQTAKKDGEKSTKTTREFNGDELVQTMEIIGGDVTCVQKFKKM